MKKIEEIQTEISEIQNDYAERTDKDGKPLYTKTQLRKAGKLAYQLQKYVYYLQAGAKEKTLLAQLVVLKERREIISKGYALWLSRNKDYANLKNPEAKYRSEMGKAKVMLQIKALEYLLN